MRGRDGDKYVLLMRFKGRIVCCCVCVCGVKGGESRRRGGVRKGGEGGGGGEPLLDLRLTFFVSSFFVNFTWGFLLLVAFAIFRLVCCGSLLCWGMEGKIVAGELTI